MNYSNWIFCKFEKENKNIEVVSCSDACGKFNFKKFDDIGQPMQLGQLYKFMSLNKDITLYIRNNLREWTPAVISKGEKEKSNLVKIAIDFLPEVYDNSIYLSDNEVELLKDHINSYNGLYFYSSSTILNKMPAKIRSVSKIDTEDDQYMISKGLEDSSDGFLIDCGINVNWN